MGHSLSEMISRGAQERFDELVDYANSLKPNHRAFVIAEIMAWIGATKPGMTLNGKRVGQSPDLDTYKVSYRVYDAIYGDMYAICEGRSASRYEAHRKKMDRALGKRKRSLARRKENPSLHRPYDSQRSRLYAAEMVIRDDGFKFETVEQMQAYVDKLTASAWWTRRYRRRHIIVKPGFGHRRATGSAWGVVQMPIWARCEAVLLHEVSHVVTCGDDSVPYHGREFAQAYLELVSHKMGKECASKLKASFQSHKVRFRKKRAAGSMSDEQRAAAIERLRIARETKAAAKEGSS